MRFESKSTQAVRALARTLLALDGENLSSTRELAEEAGVGTGTVSKALEFLSDEGTLRAQRIQRSGTTIEHLDYGRLWSYAAYGPVKGVLPMSLDASLERLVTAVTAALEAAGVQASLTYRAGALRRLQAVREGQIDFTVVSQHTLAGEDGVIAVHQFGAGSYYGTTGIYRLLRRDGGPIQSVGGCSESPDHYDLVRAEFPEAALVDVAFRTIPRLVVEGKVDATIWYGGTPVPGELVNALKTEPAQSTAAEELIQTAAVMVVASQSPAQNLFQSLDRGLLDRSYAAALHVGAHHA